MKSMITITIPTACRIIPDTPTRFSPLLGYVLGARGLGMKKFVDETDSSSVQVCDVCDGCDEA